MSATTSATPSATPSAITSSHVSLPDRQPSRRAILKSFAGAAAGAAFLAAGWVVDAAAPRAPLEVVNASARSVPVKLVIVFGRPHDVELFEGHYQTKHIPLALAMPHCASIESALAVSDASGEKAAFHRIATLAFSSETDLVACVTSDAGQAAFADIATFATGGATATIVSNIQAFTAGASREISGAIVNTTGRGDACRNNGSGRTRMQQSP